MTCERCRQSPFSYLGRAIPSAVSKRPEVGLLGLIFVGGIIVRLAVSTFPGFFGDLQDFVDWGHILNLHFLSIYSFGGQSTPLHPFGPPPAFPPLGLYVFGLCVRIFLALQRLMGWPDTLDVGQNPQLAMLMKLPAILADCAIGVILYRIARKARGAGWGMLAAALWMFSPVGVFDGALWGQFDLLPVPFLLLAVLLAARQRHLAAGLLLGVSLALKPQAWIFIPLVFVYVGRWSGISGLWRAGIGVGGVTSLVWLPYIGGELAAFQANVRTTLVEVPFASSHAFNLWWLLGVGLRASNEPLVGRLSISTAGWILFALAAAVVLLRAIRTPSEGELLLDAAILGVAFFVLSPLQHERYIAPALPLLLAAAVRSAWGLGWYLTLSVAAVLNMALVALPSLGPNGQILGLAAHVDEEPVVALAIALAMVLTLALLLERAARAPTVAAP